MGAFIRSALTAFLFTVVLISTAQADTAKSRFLNQLTSETYTEVEAPKGPQTFRWDFSKKAALTYDYAQDVVSKTDMDPENGVGNADQKVSTRGELLIKSQGDGSADFVFKDLKARMEFAVSKDEPPKIMEQSVPPLVVEGVKENGSGPFGDKAQDMMLKLLFPLPPKALKVGETVEVPAQFLFTAMGSQLPVKGRSRITVSRYVSIGSHTCAQLNVDTDISDLRIPPELEGRYSSSVKSSAIFFFDTNSRSFVSGVSAVLFQAEVESSRNMPEKIKLSVTSDNLMRVKLRE